MAIICDLLKLTQINQPVAPNYVCKCIPTIEVNQRELQTDDV